jgi:site-specific DNA-methyltransferase (adenine-specific)
MEAIQLYHGDCLGENGMRTLGDKSIDMILCDLPYGVMGGCKWDAKLDLEEVFKQYNRVVKDNGAIVLFAIQPFTTELICANKKHFRYTMVWNKKTGSDFFNANKRPMRAHEDIVVFYKKQPLYNIQKTVGKPFKRHWPEKEFFVPAINGYMTRHTGSENTGDRFPTTVLEFKRIYRTTSKHPTQKPVSLLEWLIKTYTNEGEIVLDNTYGSGSTAVACKNTKRRFVGWELEEKYYKVALERLEKEGDNFKDADK